MGFDIRLFVAEEASIYIDGTGMLSGWNWLDTRSMYIARIQGKPKAKTRKRHDSGQPSVSILPRLRQNKKQLVKQFSKCLGTAPVDLCMFELSYYVIEASISIDGTGMLSDWNWLDTRSMHIARIQGNTNRKTRKRHESGQPSASILPKLRQNKKQLVKQFSKCLGTAPVDLRMFELSYYVIRNYTTHICGRVVD